MELSSAVKTVLVLIIADADVSDLKTIIIDDEFNCAFAILKSLLLDDAIAFLSSTETINY